MDKPTVFPLGCKSTVRNYTTHALQETSMKCKKNRRQLWSHH